MQPCQSRPSAEYVAAYAGVWQINGRFDDPMKANEPVDFWVMLLSDGTFRDRDNYRGRWVASESSFALAYIDESRLLYVGGPMHDDRVESRFSGEDTSGSFEMRRSARQ